MVSALLFFSAAASFLFLLWLSSHKVLLSATLISKRAKVRKIVVHTQSWVSRTLYNSSKQFSPFSRRTHVRELRIEAILHQIHFFKLKKHTIRLKNSEHETSWENGSNGLKEKHYYKKLLFFNKILNMSICPKGYISITDSNFCKVLRCYKN